MKVIMKPQRVETYEAVEVTKDMGILTDEPTIKQEIIEIDGELILKAHEIDNNDIYSSVQDIDIKVKEGDLLIKTPKGYMKPVANFIRVTDEIEKAITLLNELK